MRYGTMDVDKADNIEETRRKLEEAGGDTPLLIPIGNWVRSNGSGIVFVIPMVSSSNSYNRVRHGNKGSRNDF
jgi:hypothetical protein